METADKFALVQPAPSIVERRRPELVETNPGFEPEEGTDLRAYWRVLQKHSWTILAVLLAVFTVGLIATLKQAPVYRARAMVEIEKENPDILTVQELFQLENISDSYLETQYKILASESLARHVIEKLRLDEVKEFNPAPRFWNWKANQATKNEGGPADPAIEQAILKRFQDRLGIDPVRQSRLVQASFESEDPQLAAKVVNAITAGYIEENLENRWEATQKAAEWLSQQLEELKIRLEKSEDELQHYAQANGLLFLESEQGVTENIVDERLRQLQDEMTKAQADRYQKESLYRLVQADDYASLPGVVDNKLMQDLTLRLADLENNYAQLSTAFSPGYPRMQELQNQIGETQATLSRERQRVAERITNDYTVAARREALVQQAFQEQQKRANDVAARAVQYNILKREVDTNKQLYEGLLQRMKEAGVSAGLKASNIRIVDAAIPPVKPVKPRVVLNLALAFLLGLCGGIGVAFLQEHLDNSLKSTEDVERFLQLPTLAAIPAAESLSGNRRSIYGLAGRERFKKEGHATLLRSPSWLRIDEVTPQYAALPEAFRSLRTSVLLSTAGSPPRSLLITSTQAAEGKTTVAMNLAISLAQLGQRVLLVDADLRRPSIHRIFRIPSAPGLVSYLAGRSDWPAVVVSGGVEGLDLIPSGPVPPNPVELLSSERMRQLLREAAGRYTMVVLDSPPLLSVADSRVLGTQVEGVVLVVRGSATPRELAQRAQAYAQDVGANVIGAVLNSVDTRSGEYYYYRDRYYNCESGGAGAEGKCEA